MLKYRLNRTTMRIITILLLLTCFTGGSTVCAAQNSLVTTNFPDKALKLFVLVDGEVQKPGRYDWFPGMAVVDVINAAGGLKQSASHRIRIIRKDGYRSIFNADTFPYGQKTLPVPGAGYYIEMPSNQPTNGMTPVKPPKH